MLPPLLAAPQTRLLLAARAAGTAQVAVSLDLGLSSSSVALDAAGVQLPDGQHLTWAQIEAITAHDTACFRIEDQQPHQIQAYSGRLDRFYSLMPTATAPTVLIAGFPMHRIKDSDPLADTRTKVRTVAPVKGTVLDTATGLGYTAIEAARTAERVLTIELDPTTLEIARQNPWSQPLFRNPKIEQRIGNAYEVLPTLPERSFHRILHDPPIFKLAGELYSEAFYRELWRVLRPGGRLFHYIGSLESKSGHGVMRGVVRRLQAAGFERISRRPEAFGVVAVRGD